MRKKFANNKSKLGYWEARIFIPTGAANWHVEIQYQRQRHKLGLGTPNKTAAAARAMKLYDRVRADGWEIALSEYRPHMAEKKTDLSVGEFLEALYRTADAKRETIDGYVIALRKIVSDLESLSDDPSRFAPHGAGRQEWLAKVHSVKLAALTPARVQKWKRDFLCPFENDPLKLRTAQISVNSFLRRAKSLFSKKLTKHLGAIVFTNPFDGVAFEKRQSMRYRSGFDVRELLQAAREELFSAEPELFKIFLLAVTCGLRRGEIDLLPWTAFRWDDGLLRIEPTQFFHPKSEYSLGDIDVEPEILAIFRGLYAKARSKFVVESASSPQSKAANYYRCNELFEKLIGWLQEHGVTDRKGLHALRKEYGSQVCDRHGLYAASRALRHASVTITAAHYLDKKSKVTSGLGASFSDKVTPAVSFVEPPIATGTTINAKQLEMQLASIRN